MMVMNSDTVFSLLNSLHSLFHSSLDSIYQFQAPSILFIYGSSEGNVEAIHLTYNGSLKRLNHKGISQIMNVSECNERLGKYDVIIVDSACVVSLIVAYMSV